MRLRGSLDANLESLQTNLVCYPRMHFLLPSYAPFQTE
jgi:tubulin alpha